MGVSVSNLSYPVFFNNDFLSLCKKIEKNKAINEAFNNKKQKTLVILLGGPGAGKSYIANLFVNKFGFRKALPDDYLTAMLKRKENKETINVDLNNPSHKNAYVWAATKNDERLEFCFKNGYPVVTEKTGQNFNTVLTLKKLAESYGYKVFCLYVEIDPSIALTRNQQRSDRKLASDQDLLNTHEKVKDNIHPSSKGMGYSGLFGDKFFTVSGNSQEEIDNIVDFLGKQ